MERQNTESRQSNGRFGGGNPGRPVGARNRTPSKYALTCEEHTGLAFRVLHDRLLDGDLKAALFVLSRVLPSERLIELPSSEPHAWADAMAEGVISPAEAAKAAQALKTINDATIVVDLQARLDELETRLSLGSGRG